MLAGVPVHVVAQRLGHAKAAMTLNVYAHVLPSADDEAVRRLSMALYGSEDDPPAASTAAPPLPAQSRARRARDKPAAGPVQPSLLDEP